MQTKILQTLELNSINDLIEETKIINTLQAEKLKILIDQINELNVSDFKKLTDALNAEQLKMLTDKLKEFAISDQNQEMLDKINEIIRKLKVKETFKQQFIDGIIAAIPQVLVLLALALLISVAPLLLGMVMAFVKRHSGKIERDTNSLIKAINSNIKSKNYEIKEKVLGKTDGIGLFKVDAEKGITVSIEINEKKEDIKNNEHYFASSNNLLNKITQLINQPTDNLNIDKKQQNKTFMNSFLLHGPYGLGKTSMLDAIQKSFDKSITLRISCEKLGGDPQKNIQNIENIIKKFIKALDIKKNTRRTFIVQIDEIDKLKGFISSKELLEIVNQSNSGNGSAKSKYINRLLLIAGNSIENTIYDNKTIYQAIKSRVTELTLCNLQFKDIMKHYNDNLKKLENFKNTDHVNVVIDQLQVKIEENLSDATDEIANYIATTIDLSADTFSTRSDNKKITFTNNPLSDKLKPLLDFHFLNAIRCDYKEYLSDNTTTSEQGKQTKLKEITMNALKELKIFDFRYCNKILEAIEPDQNLDINSQQRSSSLT